MGILDFMIIYVDLSRNCTNQDVCLMIQHKIAQL